MISVGSRFRRTLVGFGLICISFTWPGPSAAEIEGSASERFSVNSWTIGNGLPGNAVVGLAKGGDGYLWLATINGPARFDGARVVPVQLWDGLLSLLTQRLLADHRGRLWIGTQDAGLTLLTEGRYRSFTPADGLPGHNVAGLAEDEQGGIWVATDEGLARWDGKFTNMTPPTEKPRGFTSVCCGAQRTFAVSDGWKVWERNENSWNTLPPLGVRGFRFDQVFVSRAGVLWSQLNPKGLARLEEPPGTVATTNQAAPGKQVWRFFGTECGLPDTYISCALEKSNGDFLFGSFEQGLYRFHEGHATPVALNELPDRDGVLALHEDSDGNLWAGTRTHGLLRLRQPRVRTVAGAEAVRIARIAFDKSGRLWVGGGEGLWFGKEGALSRAPLPDRLQKWNVGALLPAADGGVWIGLFNGGLWKFNPDKDEKPLPQLPNANLNASVVALAADRADGTWFGTVGGRIVHVAHDGVKWAPPNDAGRISVLATEPAGGVWAGTEGTGVLRLDEAGKVQLHLGREQGLPGRAVRSLVPDQGGVVWIGTVGGLCRWDGSHLQVYDIRNGLPDDRIASLAQDDAGHLWCSANNALFRLDKSELGEIAAGGATLAHPMLVGPSDGLKAVPFATGIPSDAIRGPAGQLYFPRIWEVLTLAPRDFEKAPVAPRPRIEEVLVDGQPADLRAIGRTAVRVPPRSSQIEIRYTAFQWTSPETLRFRYRLTDVDKSWTEAGDQRVATFRRLPPGSYSFEVTAAVGGAEWAKSAATLKFVIEPMFWQTVWFRGLIIVVGLSAIVALLQRRVRSLEKRRAAQELFSRRLLESQEAERRRIAAELHDGLGQNLVLVKNLTAMQQWDGANARPALRTGEIAAAADRALEEVHAISYALRPPELDRLGLGKAIAAMVRRAGEASGISFETHVDFEGKLPRDADIQLFRIAQEAVNNLIKHSGAKTARVELWQEQDGVHLVVSDDGRGLPAAQERAKAGNGLGLSGIEERARLISAHYRWLSNNGKGTTLSVLVKI